MVLGEVFAVLQGRQSGGEGSRQAGTARETAHAMDELTWASLRCRLREVDMVHRPLGEQWLSLCQCWQVARGTPNVSAFDGVSQLNHAWKGWLAIASACREG